MITGSPELWALDMDRTLVDIDAVMRRLTRVAIDVANIDAGLLAATQEKAQAEGGSFDVLGWLGAVVSSRKVEKIYQLFGSNEEGDELLYPDVRPFLEAIDRSGSPCIIPTYGANDWQTAKLQASGLIAREYLITSTKYKGELIADWHQPAGYTVRAASGKILVAQTVTLVDDKADAFRGLPEDCSGYHVRRTGGPLLASQQGEVPSNVQTITSLEPLTG